MVIGEWSTKVAQLWKIFPNDTLLICQLTSAIGSWGLPLQFEVEDDVEVAVL